MVVDLLFGNVCSTLNYFSNSIICFLLSACSVYLMHSDFLEASVFHMKKPVGGCGHLRQTNKADSEKPWYSHYTECSVNLKSIR